MPSQDFCDRAQSHILILSSVLSSKRKFRRFSSCKFADPVPATGGGGGGLRVPQMGKWCVFCRNKAILNLAVAFLA